MRLRLGIENGMDGRCMAWALDYPGLYSYGANVDEALAALPSSAQAYVEWNRQHGGPAPFQPAKLKVNVDETWNSYIIGSDFEPAEEGYEVNAWFRNDWKPLSAKDVQLGLKLLTWSREDVLASVDGLYPEYLDAPFPGERWTIRGVLGHIGRAEWWYLDRLGLAFPRLELPEDVFQRLELVRARLNQILPTLAGSRQVIGIDGEFWSPRKLLRRVVWHERDHAEHILKLIKKQRTKLAAD